MLEPNLKELIRGSGVFPQPQVHDFAVTGPDKIIQKQTALVAKGGLSLLSLYAVCENSDVPAGLIIEAASASNLSVEIFKASPEYCALLAKWRYDMAEAMVAEFANRVDAMRRADSENSAE